MNTTKIIIATSIILLFSTLLSGCGYTFGNSKVSSSQVQIIEGLKLAAEVQKDVEIKLTAERDKNTVDVKVSLVNSSGKALTSVQSWLSFDPSKLKGAAFDVSQSPFSLTAPLESNFDNENGLAMLGRANDHPVSDPYINVATLTFEILKEGTTMVHFYDYKPDLSGHVSSNVILDGKPYNVLMKPVNPALIIQ